MNWFKFKENLEQTKPTVVEQAAIAPPEPPQGMPAYSPGMGLLDSRSQTWIFISVWANQALKKAREKNDSVNCDLTKTAVLRGEIKILKELINLPNPKPSRGLLLDEE